MKFQAAAIHPALPLVLTFVAFVLLLLVSLSVPVIKTIALFKLSVNVDAGILKSGVSETVAFGLWGYCTSPVDVSVVGIDRKTPASCSFGFKTGGAVPIPDHVISSSVAAVLALHPVACVLTFVSLVSSIVMIRRGMAETTPLSRMIPVALGFFAFVIAASAFFIDVSAIGLAKSKVSSATGGDVKLDWGNAIWLVLGATIMLLLATCSSIFARRRQKQIEPL